MIQVDGIFSSGSNVSITEGTVDSISTGKYASFSVTVQVPSDKRITVPTSSWFVYFDKLSTPTTNAFSTFPVSFLY